MKISLIVILVVLVVLAVALVGVFVWQKNNPATIGHCINGQLADCLNTDKRQQIQDEILGWKTSLGAGLMIKCPLSWYWNDDYLHTNISCCNFDPVNSSASGSSHPACLEVDYYRNKGVSLEEAIKSFWGDNKGSGTYGWEKYYFHTNKGWAFDNSLLIPTQIDNINGYKIVNPLGENLYFFYFEDKFYLIYPKTIRFDAIQRYTKPNTEDSNIIDKTISTIKFISPTADHIPTMIDVNNAYYSSVDYGSKPIKLIDGSYYYDCGLTEEKKCYIEIDTYPDFGDLNNDGKDEVAVILTKNEPQFGHLTLFVLQKENNSIVQIASTMSGLDIWPGGGFIRSLKIEKGKIVIRLNHQGTEEQKVYLLSGNSLILQ